MRSRAAASVLALAGCVPIDGGAVEFRWTIRGLGEDPRHEEGRQVDCSEAGITHVALQVDPGTAGAPEYRFECDDGHGSSDFDVTPGNHLFGIVPLGPQAGAATVPDPILAPVHDGQLTDLQVLLIRVP